MDLCAMQSTLFNALSENAKAQAANFPFCTIEPNVGLVAVPDPRLEVSCGANAAYCKFFDHPWAKQHA